MLIHKNKILLVRHWYNPLWVMPGGGIKKNETPEQAAIRELKEETGIHTKQLDCLLGVYSNTREGKNDTVYCFIVELQDEPILIKQKFNIEISDIILSDFKQLPERTSAATRNRISEYIAADISREIRMW